MKIVIHLSFYYEKSCRYLVLLLYLTGLALPVSAITLIPGTSYSSSNTISNGDPVYITGVATGHPRSGLQVWLVGYNRIEVSTVVVNDDNTYKYELRSADTQNLASGQYLVIVQHPMMNGQFDITYSPATGQVTNRQLGGGMTIFQMTKAGSLQSTDAASALIGAINSQNVDDTFVTASFYISPPDAFVKPVGDHVVGEKFTISGTTNLAVGDKLQVDVYSSSFLPTSKSQSGEYSGKSGVVEVMPGTDGRNTWSFGIDASGFRPDEYIVKVSGITQTVTGSATFNIIESLPPSTQVPTTIIPLQKETPLLSVPSIQVSTTEIPTTRKSAFPLWVCTGAALIAFAVLRLKKSA